MTAFSAGLATVSKTGLLLVLLLTAAVGAGIGVECSEGEMETVLVQRCAFLEGAQQANHLETPPSVRTSFSNSHANVRRFSGEVCTPLAPHGRPDNTRGDPTYC